MFVSILRMYTYLELYVDIFQNLNYKIIQILPEYDQQLKIIFNAHIRIFIRKEIL